MKKKVIEYVSLTEEFAATKNWKRVDLPKNFRYIHTNWFYRAWSHFFYYAIAVPVIYLVAKLGIGYKTVGRKKLKKLRHKGGFFIYMNHTSALSDVCIPPLTIGIPHRTRIICNREAVSKPVIRSIVTTLAGVPLPNEDDISLGKDFVHAIEHYIKKGDDVVVFPEAHIWPYCTFLRPFASHAFVYPARLGTPIVAAVTTYKQRKILKFLPPTRVLHLGGPFYPDMSLSLSERADKLEKDVREFMEEKLGSFDNYEHVIYRKKEE